MAVRGPTLRLLHRLRVTVGREADDTVRALAVAWTRAWNELAEAWQAAVAEIVADAAAQQRWPAPWRLARMDRLASATLASGQALTGLGTEAGVSIAEAGQRVIAATVDAEPRIIASQLPGDAAAAAAARYAAAVPQGALAAVVQRTTRRITALTRPLSGDAYEAMQRALVRGVAVGDSPRAAARDMVGRVRGVFDGGLGRATTIARTEMLDAYRVTAAAVHEANGDVLDGWRWLASVDRRCCPACVAMHGTTHRLAAAGPLGHPNCRCARVPKLRPWRDLGIAGSEPDDLIGDAGTAFAALAPADQIRILGPARLALLRSGEVGWSDLVRRRDNRGWRPSYEPTPLRDLRRTA